MSIFIYEHLICKAQNLHTSFEIPKIFIKNPRFSKLKKESGQKLIEKIKLYLNYNKEQFQKNKRSKDDFENVKRNLENIIKIPTI